MSAGSLPGLEMAQDPPYGTTNFQSFWIVLPDDFPMSRNDLLRMMLDQGISARRGIMAAHLEPAYADHQYGNLPVTERLTARSIIVPLFPQMSEADQDRVVGAIAEAAVASASRSR